MARVLHCLKAAPLDLGEKFFAPDQALDVPDLALDDATAPRLGRIEKLRQPFVRVEVIGAVCGGACHAPMRAHHG